MMTVIYLNIKHCIVEIDRVNFFGDLSYLEIYKCSMHSGSYQDCPT